MYEADRGCKLNRPGVAYGRQRSFEYLENCFWNIGVGVAEIMEIMSNKGLSIPLWSGG